MFLAVMFGDVNVFLTTPPLDILAILVHGFESAMCIRVGVLAELGESCPFQR